MRVICVAGARPNYMKVKPVMDALEERAADVILVHTGQHYDAAMNDVFFADLGIRPPDHRLQVGSAPREPSEDRRCRRRIARPGPIDRRCERQSLLARAHDCAHQLDVAVAVATMPSR